MKRLLLSLILLTLPAILWPRTAVRKYILVARRSEIAEIVDAESLQTLNRFHFDFLVERLSGVPDSRTLNIDGYKDGPCCKHYTLDSGSGKLSEFVPASGPRYYGEPITSRDGRWSVRLKSFQGPALRIADLTGGGPARELIPPGLPPEDESGNWNAQGAWLDGRFYLYVSRPDDPGLLWTITPGAQSLGAGLRVAPFNAASGCRWILPVTKRLVAAGGNLLLFEPFGNRNKGSRACDDLPGGAWILDPATGRLARQIAPELHFSTLVADPAQSELFGTAVASAGSQGEPELLVRLTAQEGRVIRSRNMGAGQSLAIAVAMLGENPPGDMNVKVGVP